jgi:hypothetical protein
MFICLSSGARPRYRQDIIRAIAMPEGSKLQFRYRLDLVAQRVKQMIENGTYKNNKALIAYLDQRDGTKPPELVPCRFAKIAHAQMHGSTTSLVFVLEEFAYAENIEAFNNQARLASGNTLPLRRNPEDKYAQGAFWLEVGDEALNNVISTRDLGDWEKIVYQLVQRKDFESENCFYMIEGLYQAEGDVKVNMKRGSYHLKPSKEYEVRIYHFLPRTAQKTVSLRLDISRPSITFTTNCIQIIDSEYDMKRIRFKTDQPVLSEKSILSVFRTDGDTGNQIETLDFDVQLQTAGVWGLKLILGIGIGILLAAPHITAAMGNNQLSNRIKCVIVLVSVIASILAGIIATFGLKKISNRCQICL